MAAWSRRSLMAPIFILMIVATFSSACSSVSKAQPSEITPQSDAVFRELILQRLQAFGRGDGDGYRRLIASDFVHIMDTGVRRNAEEMVARVAANVGAKSRFEVGELHTRVYGQIAVVDCEVIAHDAFGPREITTPFRETDVFIWREGRWQYLHHEETLETVNPKTEAPASASLDDYVGRYEWWPGYVDIITRRGSKLYGQDSPAATPTQMEAASEESFFIRGDAGLLTFPRDRRGAVTHYLLHFPNGQVIMARKISGGARPNSRLQRTRFQRLSYPRSKKARR